MLSYLTTNYKYPPSKGFGKSQFLGRPLSRTLSDPDTRKVWVFPYKGNRLAKMNSSAWKHARVEAATAWVKEKCEPAHPGFAHLRVHDLKHTFGRRLRVAGVAFEDRQALLDHKSGSVTTDYSVAGIEHLIAQANKVTMMGQRSSPTLTVLRRRSA